MMGFTSVFANLIQILIMFVAWLIVIISFFVMAIQLFVSLIEFKLTTLAGFVLVPFGLFGRTAFLAERVLGNVVSSGIKILVLAVIIGIGSTIFGQFTSALNNPPTIASLRKMGIRTVMITGDNALTAAAIAAESGVDDFLAQATPEAKLKLIRDEQAKGKLVAMCGDGTNDAPALAQADVGVAMNTGTMAAREAGNMVDLDSDPTKLIEIVEIGKQLLMTRGALTTFSISNDVAKYFAIIPAMFVAFYPQLQALNIMGLASPKSAILSAIIFNALVIIALIPLALKGVAYRATGAEHLLHRNLLVYGLGGLIVPFIGIKLIDLAVTAIGLA
jgi:K+-transporting ATPase B subunit